MLEKNAFGWSLNVIGRRRNSKKTNIVVFFLDFSFVFWLTSTDKKNYTKRDLLTKNTCYKWLGRIFFAPSFSFIVACLHQE